MINLSIQYPIDALKGYCMITQSFMYNYIIFPNSKLKILSRCDSCCGKTSSGNHSIRSEIFCNGSIVKMFCYKKGTCIERASLVRQSTGSRGPKQHAQRFMPLALALVIKNFQTNLATGPSNTCFSKTRKHRWCKYTLIILLLRNQYNEPNINIHHGQFSHIY